MKHFKLEEFACKHCGQVQMDETFLEKLDELRERCGFPFVITSGYRCPEHNRVVSNTGLLGPHTTGRAADVKVRGRQAMLLIYEALDMGVFTGIGLNQKGTGRYVHLDTLANGPNSPRPTIWTY